MTSREGKPSEEALVKAAAENWEQFWSGAFSGGLSFPERGLWGRVKRFIRRAGSFELTYRLISKEFGHPRDQFILEAGSGSGEVSLLLAAGSNRVLQLDTSISGLRHSRGRAQIWGVAAYQIKGSIFNLPFKSDAFDGVFNVGVLDHFGPEYRTQAAREMIRSARVGGRIAILTNDARSWMHPRAMKYALKKGTWPHGIKLALHTLKDATQNAAPSCEIREYSCGFVSQFEFLRHCFPPDSSALRWFYRLYFPLSFPLGFLNRWPGQYLVTVIDKSDAA